MVNMIRLTAIRNDNSRVCLCFRNGDIDPWIAELDLLYENGDEDIYPIDVNEGSFEIQISCRNTSECVWLTVRKDKKVVFTKRLRIPARRMEEYLQISEESTDSRDHAEIGHEVVKVPTEESSACNDGEKQKKHAAVNLKYSLREISDMALQMIGGE